MMTIHFLYGAYHTYVDVTAKVFAKCVYGNRVFIPAGDTGAAIFDDPLPGIAKGILVVRQDGDMLSAQAYGANEKIWITLGDDVESTVLVDSRGGQSGATLKNITLPPPGYRPQEILNFFHSQLRFTGGDLSWELIEQLNVVEFLSPNAKVLELGSGYGTNTMIISCILNDEADFVTLECNEASVDVVRQNRAANNFRFHIEPAALSYKKLMYNPQLMITIPGEELQEGYEWIKTVTFEDLKNKYEIEFDTLVADCEGALYYILQDNVHLLDNIMTVILESDYRIAGQKWAVEAIFSSFGFAKVKSWTLPQGGDDLPQECRDSFWEVWVR